VDRERAVEEARTDASHAVLARGRYGRLLELGVGRQAEVVIGTRHYHLPAFDHDLGILAGFDNLKVRVNAGRYGGLGHGEFFALLEDIRPLK